MPELRFIRGPLDGFSQFIAHTPPQNMQEYVWLPVSEAVLEALSGQPPSKPGPVKYQALYRFEIDDRGWRYEYERSQKAEAGLWDAWCEKIVRCWQQHQTEQ